MFSPRPSAPPISSEVIFVRPIVDAWNGSALINEPPPPYQSPEPTVTLNIPRHNQPHRSDLSQTAPTEHPHFLASFSEHGSATVVRERQRPKLQLVTFEKQYLYSKFAILKGFEFVACSVAFSSCFAFRDKFGIGFFTGDRSGFFMLLHLLSWLLVVLLFWASLIGYMKEIATPSQFIKMIITHVSLGFLILISSALLTDAPFMGLCETTTTACVMFKIAVAFGYFAVILFWIDATLHYRTFKNSVLVF